MDASSCASTLETVDAWGARYAEYAIIGEASVDNYAFFVGNSYAYYYEMTEMLTFAYNSQVANLEQGEPKWARTNKVLRGKRLD